MEGYIEINVLFEKLGQKVAQYFLKKKRNSILKSVVKPCKKN